MNPILSIILGAIAGYILPYMIDFFVFILKRKHEENICGKWHAYIWWTKDEKVSIDKMTALIGKRKFWKRNKISEYTVIFSDLACRFDGYAYIERTDLCIDMVCDDIGMKGHTYHRYNLSKVLTKGMCFGIWLSTNTDDRISCGSALLSRDMKSYEELNDLINENFIVYHNSPIINLK